MINALTIDVEEYYHPSEVQHCAPEPEWDLLPSRIEGQVSRVLDLLDEARVEATFFVLGYVAEKHPRLIRRIAARGHDVACHSYAHRLVYELSPTAFRQDTLRAVSAIADSCGVRPTSYRAPSYSITDLSFWALEVLVECGFDRDSSICPVRHDRYGIPGFSRHATIVDTPSGPIQEVPVATVDLANGVVVPVGGGGYLRLLPYRYTAAGLRRINQRERQPACVYFHPWELDPGQPRLAPGAVSRLRTYLGLAGMERKVTRLLEDFRFSTLRDVYPLTRAAAMR